jgi:nucleoside-specific outer membrane channel protein Tsx
MKASMSMLWPLVIGLLAACSQLGPAVPTVQNEALLALGALERKLTASDGAAGDEFGYAVAVSGDTAMVGAPSAEVSGLTWAGAVYVFVRSNGSWSEQAKLTAGDGAEDDGFGYSVALSGDTAVVGAPWADVSDRDNAGAAYVFVRSNGGWSEQAKLTASDGAEGDEFGSSVALSRDTIVVGAPFASLAGRSWAGAVYVFVRSNGSWSEQAKLTAGDGAAGDEFGTSVAVSGDTAVVGADGADVSGRNDAGAAYVFARTNGGWSEQAKLTASDGAAVDLFGYSVALSGDTAIVGAPRAGHLRTGAAYVFARSNGSWSEQTKLTASDGAFLDFFGSSVALSGDTAVVGAFWADVSGRHNAGAAYAFVRSDGSWSEQAKLTASDGAAGDELGTSVAVSGDTAIMGAPFAAPAGRTDAGAAYVYELDTTPPTIALASPADGAVYLLNEVVYADYGCEDETGGSGLASCAGEVSNGAAIDTASVGEKSFTVHAADNAGNLASLTHNYTVVYAFEGFLEPVNNHALNVVKAGQAISLRWRLTDAQGVAVTDLAGATVTVTNYSCSLSETEDELGEDTAGKSGLQSLGDGNYRFSWKTPRSYANSCKTMQLDLGEGIFRTASFKFTR